MAKKKIEYISGESYQEEEQGFVGQAPTMEGYDPTDSNLPYIPAMAPQQPIPTPQFVDINNPQSYAQPHYTHPHHAPPQPQHNQ